jgi:uncharacterized membrane protein (UPF0136 family)
MVSLIAGMTSGLAAAMPSKLMVSPSMAGTPLPSVAFFTQGKSF